MIKDLFVKSVLYLIRAIEIITFRKPVWLVYERGNDANDNGLWMFRYLQKYHPEIDSRYVITKDSPDRRKLKEYKKKLLELPSWELFFLLFKSRYLLTAHFGEYSEFLNGSQKLENLIHKILKNKKIVRLQHGISMNESSFLFSYHKTDLFICGAKPEYEYISQTHYFPSNIVKYTGLARFDGLYNINPDKNVILIMPTWRRWIKDEREFLESNYFNKFSHLLQDKDLQEALHIYGLKIVFNLHPCFRQYIKSFANLDLPDSISVVDSINIDIQELLKKASMLVTDYSSVAFDMVYMGKPICYYQFDEQEFRDKHFKEGYYSYREGLGPWIDNEKDLIECIVSYAKKNFEIQDLYKTRIANFFPIRDQKNCERIFNEIINLH